MAGTITHVRSEGKARGLVKIKATILVDASGNATATVIGEAYGKLVAVGYAPGTLDTGADITLTDSDSGATIFSLTNAGTSGRYFRPTQVITTNAGVAVTAAATAVDVNRDIYLAGKLKLAVAQGGNALTGKIWFVVDETGN